MESVLTIICIVALASWAFRQGKYQGSRAAFHVGWRKGRQSRRRRE